MELKPLVSFVRCTLGCGCPDELLQSMQLVEPQPLPGLALPCRRLEVGGRLLVLVVSEPFAGSTVAEVVRQALQHGVGERDRLGFNRLRLVLAAADPGSIEGAARSAFVAGEPPDDRCHLHVVHLKQLPPGLHGD